MLEILFLLLPLAFYAGWRSAHKQIKQNSEQTKQMSTRFVTGINYLLNEDPDRALDVFLSAPNSEMQAIETFLAMGKMFRNRGEVNRALKIHQYLLARSDLTGDQRQTVMFALGNDFLAAGLLDRAESAFTELISTYPQQQLAYLPLRHIYEQLQEWDKAIFITQQSLDDKTKKNSLIAHYLCEQATLFLSQQELFKADEKIKAARALQTSLARIPFLQAELASARQQKAVALEFYQQAIQMDARLLSLVVRRLLTILKEPADVYALQRLVQAEYLRQHNPKLLPALLAVARYNPQEPDLVPLVRSHLQQEAVTTQSITYATQYLSEISNTEIQALLADVSSALHRLLKTLPQFQCLQCGYKLHDYVWRCPACHQWDSIDHT